MAETTPTITVDDPFELSADFGNTASSEEEFQSFRATFDASGQYLCSQEWDTGTRYTSEADYCDGTPDIVAALTTLLTAFGDVISTTCVQSRTEIRFEAGVGAHISLEGHQHTTNPHVNGTLLVANVASVIPVSSGNGVPVLITAVGASATPLSATLTFEMEHIDKAGADGTHFAGQNLRCHVTLSVDYEGHPTSITPGDWLNIVLVKSKSNEDTPTATVTAEQWIDVS